MLKCRKVYDDSSGNSTNNSAVCPMLTRTVRDLGVYINSGLTMQIVSWCFAVLRQLHIPHVARYQLPVAYCCTRSFPIWITATVFGLPAINLIQRLQSVQNAAARLVFRIRRSEHIAPAPSAFTGCASQNVSPSNWQL